MFGLIFLFFQVVNESYDALFPLLSETWPDTFPETVFSRKNFVWAVQLWGSYGMKLKFPDSEIKTGIAPVACFLNHSVSDTWRNDILLEFYLYFFLPLNWMGKIHLLCSNLEKTKNPKSHFFVFINFLFSKEKI